MKHSTKRVAILLIMAFLAGTILSSCRVFMGDPRKNCNHPEHGKYVLEKRKQKTGF
ncbi:MAG: hypothetical protein KDD63_22345 [Bacteroidetes bacterium]|nr:hypothetical protein [Bacteroidota bacterium]MCB0844006.1 hypothetical protein [Bacteroidota bacterium]MCB0854986.1 hypothetical protein [Bacteroidota bacterium]